MYKKKPLLTFILFVVFSSILFASQDTARESPDWVKNGIIYEVFPRDFGPNGTFNEVKARIPELKDLGVNILWIMPIHPIGVVNRKGTFGSPYSVRDYLGITPDYGNLSDLQSLVQTAHQNNMKVILDLVANHTAWDYSWITTHPEFYHHDTTGNIISPNPYWTDVAWLDYSNSTLRNEMLNVVTYWVQTCDFDGYRCDYAEGVPLDFWDSVRDTLGSIKPDIFMLAEGYKPEHHLKAFDMSYSWPTYGMLLNVYNGSTSPIYLISTMTTEREMFPVNSLFLRYIDNHDQNRAPLVFGEEGWKPAAAFIFLINGVPMLYNGQEIGDTTRTNGGELFEKSPIDWSLETTTRTQEYYSYYSTLIDYRKTYPALFTNNIQFVPNDQSDSVVSFLRWNQGQTLLAVINFANHPVTVSVDLTSSPVKGMSQLKNLKKSVVLKKVSGNSTSITIPAYDYSLTLVQQTTYSGLVPAGKP